MKHNHNHDNAAGPQLVPIRFEYYNPTAATVYVAGTFNNWHPTAKSMHRSENGLWLKESALAPGAYEYCLIVDGKWIPDPRARETVSNPFGGRNSVLTVFSSPGAAHLIDAEILPLKKITLKT